MGYIIVKDFNNKGCLCFSIKDLDVMRKTLNFLNGVVDVTRIQVVCLNDPSMYGEYAPYRFIEDLGDFIKEALNM